MNKQNPCPCAPFGMPCVFDAYDCVACARNKIHYYLTDIATQIPVIGDYIPRFHCPDYEYPKHKQEGGQ